MTKPIFGVHSQLLEFEQPERLVEITSRTAGESYPPFNIEAIAEHEYQITLAVAGFSEDSIAISVEDRQLVIRGRQPDSDIARTFLHRGIAARAFQRSFVLADGVEVARATLKHGLLSIGLRRSLPDQVVRTIVIERR